MKRLFILTALLLPCAANADIVNHKWDQGAFAHAGKIAPKKFIEICGKLAKGEQVGWQFTATGPTNFNIHYHVGKDVLYPERRNAVDKGDGTLMVALDQDYCWMWSNKGDTEVNLEVRLRKP
ncbi:MAG: hypothetical protein JNK75_05315 [Betaproteobacteria bacterium]|nr:hypothetical protein [Betaproteobacteria bacterium]